LVVLAALGLVAAGCMGGGSSHGTLSAKDAIAQVREDGFVKVQRDTQPASWLCHRNFSRLGPTTPAGKFADYVRPSYVLRLEDARVPATADNSARIAMMVVVLPDAATAKQCAKAGIHGAMHRPVHSSNPFGPFIPYKLIDSTTVETGMHAPGAEGFANNEDDGEYETWLAHGRVFALGLAYNESHSKIVREDLERLAAEISG
jgi:hypothetical protein